MGRGEEGSVWRGKRAKRCFSGAGRASQEVEVKAARDLGAFWDRDRSFSGFSELEASMVLGIVELHSFVEELGDWRREQILQPYRRKRDAFQSHVSGLFTPADFETVEVMNFVRICQSFLRSYFSVLHDEASQGSFCESFNSCSF